MNIIYFCPSEGLYGDNKALLRIMPYLIHEGITPLFIVAFKGDMVNYLHTHNYNYIISNCNCWNMYDLNNPFKNFIKGLLWRLKHFIGNRRVVNKIAKDVEYFNPEIVHSNSSNSSFGYCLANKLGIKHVWHLREYGKWDNNKQFFPNFDSFIRKLNNINNYTISITPLIREYYKRKQIQDTMIYDGVFNKDIKPVINYNKQKYFLYVGRLFEKKGVEDIIDAFSAVQQNDPDYKLLLAGTGNEEYAEFLKRRAIKSGCENNIVFLGYRNDVFDLMSKAKALVVASSFEGFGFITAEAMFTGCYVIGRDTAGTKLQFDNIEKNTGLQVSSRFLTEKELEDIMAKIMVNKIDVTKSLDIVQYSVAKLYDIRKSADNVFEFYKKIRR